VGPAGGKGERKGLRRNHQTVRENREVCFIEVYMDHLGTKQYGDGRMEDGSLVRYVEMRMKVRTSGKE
jgi:hypothetical protein